MPATTPAGRSAIRCTSTRITAPYPAHLHLNLLPHGRASGGARYLCETAIAALETAGVTGAHVGMDRRNETGQRFWRKMGFQPIDGPPEAVWMGRTLRRPIS